MITQHEKDRRMVRQFQAARRRGAEDLNLDRRLTLNELLEHNFIAKHFWDEKLSERVKRLYRILSRNNVP